MRAWNKNNGFMRIVSNENNVIRCHYQDSDDFGSQYTIFEGTIGDGLDSNTVKIINPNEYYTISYDEWLTNRELYENTPLELMALGDIILVVCFKIRRLRWKEKWL